ncbi:MBL fold metallo-hydrolase [Radiobacillus sp. PE A8.2]|uniref:MBL fold metallo-hydrolase n=1 Tax=Radiobacillus sp. PE A8.2 TaxID=3380349 RepID=UPI00388DC4CA
MEFQQLNKTCFYFHGPVNIGYVHLGEEGMLIDAGIDKSAMKKVIKQLREHELPITHLFVTHAHADHFGGAQYLQQQFEVHTIAPIFEEAVMRYPIMEPIYLFGGNEPLEDLRNKFLEGNPITIDQVIEEGHYQVGDFSFETVNLPGHTHYQLAILIDDILFAGDAYLSEQYLHKHKLPYMTDADLAIESLNKLTEIRCQGAVPGHGEYEEDFNKTVQANINYHEKLLNWVEAKVEEYPNGISHETIVAEMCQHFGLGEKLLSQWVLLRTAVTSYLLALIKKEKISHHITGGRWIFIANR